MQNVKYQIHYLLILITFWNSYWDLIGNNYETSHRKSAVGGKETRDSPIPLVRNKK